MVVLASKHPFKYGLGELLRRRSGDRLLTEEVALCGGVRKCDGTLPLMDGPNGVDFIFADSLFAVVVVVGVVGGGDLTPPKLVPGGERVPLHGWLNFSRRF